jgi:dihydrodipicolinate reductase
MAAGVPEKGKDHERTKALIEFTITKLFEKFLQNCFAKDLHLIVGRTSSSEFSVSNSLSSVRVHFRRVY